MIFYFKKNHLKIKLKEVWYYFYKKQQGKKIIIFFNYKFD